MKLPFRPLTKKILLSYRGLPVRQRAIFWTVVIVLVVGGFPALLSNSLPNRLQKAELYFTSPDAKEAVGTAFAVDLSLRTSGTAVNAVGSVLRFNPLYLEVLNMTTEKSFCSFYLDNSFDNIKGEVRISCGLPSPGFQGDSIVVRVNFRGKTSGITNLQVEQDTAYVLANDGKGSNILKEPPRAEITLINLF